MKVHFFQQAGLLALVSVIMIMTNVIGYQHTFLESITGILLLATVALVGVTISRLMNRFVKLPTMMYVSLLGLLLACPASPVAGPVIALSNNVAFMAPATALGAFAGISLGKDIKSFAKMGWKFIVITVLVITGTFIFSAVVAHVVLKMMGSI